MRPGILVVAKAPVAGQAKTRLAADVGDSGAADLAGAALLDTLDACEQAFPPGRRVLALSGDLTSAERSAELARRLTTWDVFPQCGNGFGQRLAQSHADAAKVLHSPVVQIGMDTPQVTPVQLDAASEQLAKGHCDAVLGPASDGGWWCLGLAHPRWASGLVAVPMSTPQTGRATHTMLTSSGAHVVQTAALTDVDTLADAAQVAREAPDSRFADAWRRLAMRTHSPAELFDDALAGRSCFVHGMPQGPIELPVRTWLGSCDVVDKALLAGCAGATLDIGCGPGRLTHGLAVRGVAALGIDVAPRAVSQTRARGAQAIRRDVFDGLPAEGRWESVLLADGNIGIGGDPLRLLRRVRTLLAPTGHLVVEVAPPGSGLVTHDVHLEVGGRRSTSFGWAVVGADCLDSLAREAALRMLWMTNQGGRWFAQLVRTGGSRCNG